MGLDDALDDLDLVVVDDEHQHFALAGQVETSPLTIIPS